MWMPMWTKDVDVDAHVDVNVGVDEGVDYSGLVHHGGRKWIARCVIHIAEEHGFGAVGVHGDRDGGDLILQKNRNEGGEIRLGIRHACCSPQREQKNAAGSPRYEGRFHGAKLSGRKVDGWPMENLPLLSAPPATVGLLALSASHTLASKCLAQHHLWHARLPWRKVTNA